MFVVPLCPVVRIFEADVSLNAVEVDPDQDAAVGHALVHARDYVLNLGIRYICFSIFKAFFAIYRSLHV